MSRVVFAVIATLLMLPDISHARQKRWWEVYEEAVQHVKKEEWASAETKLLAAKAMGPQPGRSVLRYGNLRSPYFPDFYLGVVYVHTGRAALAVKQFELARQQKIDEREAEFSSILPLQLRATAEAARAEGLATGAAAAIPPVGKIEAPAGPTPAQRLDDALDKGRTALSQKNYAAAQNFLSQAVGLKLDRSRTDQLAREIQQSQATDAFDTAMQKRDVKAARTALADLQKAQGDAVAVSTLDIRVDALERSVKLLDADRAAMQAFYSGDYRRVISLTDESEKSGPLSARGSFYRACGMAALAIGGAAVDNQAVAEARRRYREAARDPGAIARDRQFISPKILQAIGAGSIP